MYNTITQLSYSEGIFQFDNNIFKEGDSVSVNIAPLMKSTGNNDDIVVLQLTVSYTIGDKVIMKYGGIAVYQVLGWEKLTGNDKAFNELIIQLWTEGLLFFRGIICEKLRGTSIERFFLPLMPEDQIITIPLQTGQQ